MHRNWQSLIKPKRLVSQEETLNDFYGKFVAEPLERGFGATIGNTLRRILVFHPGGSPLHRSRIKGVLHEFSTVPGVREDVTDIILNLKEVRLKLFSEASETIRIKSRETGPLKAGDIIASNNVAILNPDHHIATLTKDSELDMEMVVRHGKGYIPAEKNKDDMQPVGTIPIDAIFSPAIRRVNYTVTHARVGQVTDYDSLTLEVWDGPGASGRMMRLLTRRAYSRTSLPYSSILKKSPSSWGRSRLRRSPALTRTFTGALRSWSFRCAPPTA